MKNSLIVSLSNVNKIFNSNDHKTTAIKNVSLQASEGRLILLLGPSGSGKTTLLTLIAGLIEATSGTIMLYGKQIKNYTSKELQVLRANRVGFIFQTFHLLSSLTAIENIAIVNRFAGNSRSDAKDNAHTLLQKFKLSHLAKKFPQNLSQGEKQRVAVARAIANEARLIIADEPTACLETEQGFEIIRLLHSYARDENKCIIVASHDLRIQNFADVILHLKDGEIVKN